MPEHTHPTHPAQPNAPAFTQMPLFDRLRASLLEDLAPDGDLTSQTLVPEGKRVEGEVLIKADGRLCGLKLLPLIFQMAEQFVSQPAAVRTWELYDAQDSARAGKTEWDSVVKMHERNEKSGVSVNALKKDGESVTKGEIVALLKGDARTLLAGERIALNLLCHLSGIATTTAVYVSKVAHTKARILDTRKTTPLWRDLEKYAVKCGGGENHRRGLYDMVLIKDNHLALWGANDPSGAVKAARAKFPLVGIEVEVTTMEGLQNVCQNSSPTMILLDNFSLPNLRDAVAWCDEYFTHSGSELPRPLLEASGGVTLETLTAIAETGVDRVSVGALTHSVKALDISLELKI